jgi:hypothetical protein
MESVFESLPTLIKQAEDTVVGGSAKKRFVMAALHLILRDEYRQYEIFASETIDLLVRIAHDPEVIAFEQKCEDTCCSCFKVKTK